MSLFLKYLIKTQDGLILEVQPEDCAPFRASDASSEKQRTQAGMEISYLPRSVGIGDNAQED